MRGEWKLEGVRKRDIHDLNPETEGIILEVKGSTGSGISSVFFRNFFFFPLREEMMWKHKRRIPT